MRSEEGVCFALAQSERDGFFAEGTSDLFEGEELAVVEVLDEINV